MKLLFVHGWGFDASFWDRVIALLPGKSEIVHLGYFGVAAWPHIAEPCIAVTHSFGAMALLADPPAACRGLLAINGFDRFTRCGDHPGVPPRVVDRMIARLDGDPMDVLRDFHQRLGSAVPHGSPDVARLREDLAAMRDGDLRAAVLRWRAPIVALDGAEDPLLPADMRAAQFADAADLERDTVHGGGHLLPLTHPALCAAWIERLLVAA